MALESAAIGVVLTQTYYDTQKAPQQVLMKKKKKNITSNLSISLSLSLSLGLPTFTVDPPLTTTDPPHCATSPLDSHPSLPIHPSPPLILLPEPLLTKPRPSSFGLPGVAFHVPFLPPLIANDDKLQPPLLTDDPYLLHTHFIQIPCLLTYVPRQFTY